ncbi:MAG TPA: hypothetical protein DCX53_07750 [Anaerolineae bacterium]|nr:hypothetical protein [Anaerolineae bacterium]
MRLISQTFAKLQDNPVQDLSYHSGMNWKITVMIKRLFDQSLTDLKDMEGDYRVFHLNYDIAQGVLFLLIAAVSISGLMGVDLILFKGRTDLIRWMVIYRSGFILLTLIIMFVMMNTQKVRVFDRLVSIWVFSTIVFLVLFNFTRPSNYLTTPFDIIVPFAIYVVSPLTVRRNFSLAFIFSVSTLYVDHFHKLDIDPVTLGTATAAQLIVHALGLITAVQIQSYRRRSFKALIEEKDAREMVAYLANIDPLTKSLTRRHFFSFAESEFMRFKRYERPMSVMVIDVDHFKNINDTYGHHAGDLALRSLSLVAMDHKRSQDTFGRLGGEEFGLLLPETSLHQARVVAERIQTMWEQSPVNLDGELIHSTVSIGVAEVSPKDTSFDDLLRRADKMLYKAKEAGRNRVVAE